MPLVNECAEPADSWADELIRRKGRAQKIALHTLFDNGASAEIAAEREGISLTEADAEYDVWLGLVSAAWATHRAQSDADDSYF